MTTVRHITTADQLLAAGDIGPCELLRGKLIFTTLHGCEHGAIASEIAFQLTQHVKKHRLGVVLAGRPGFCLHRNPDTVRAPDVAFVGSAGRKQCDAERYFEGAPDLAVEVLSPEDTEQAVQEKLKDYLATGTKVVWVVDPRKETITVHASGSASKSSLVLSGNDRLDGGTVLPGLSLIVNELFNINS